MEMQASRTLAVHQTQAWAALNDPEVLQRCIPGCDKVEPTGENAYAVGMALKIGPVSAKFAGKIRLEDIVAPERYTLRFDGSGGVAGFGKGEAQVRLEALPPDGDAQPRCELHYTVHATVGGKIAQLGQRLIDGAAKSMAEDFFRRFDEEMQRMYPSTEAQVDSAGGGDHAAPAGATGAAGAAAEPAAIGAALGDVPAATPGVPSWAWVAGALVLVGLAWWWL